LALLWKETILYKLILTNPAVMLAHLFCHTGELSGSDFTFDGEATIGRHPDNDITLPSGVVSSHHARIYFDASVGCYCIEDLHSFNGTRVEGLRITSTTRLQGGQKITFANQHEFIFEIRKHNKVADASLGDTYASTIPANLVVPPTEVAPPQQEKAPMLLTPKAARGATPAGDWLTKDVIRSIVDRDKLVVRNLQVTQGYYRLSEGMRHLIGDRNVSWCTFATHASKTAGQALRHELMPRLLKSAMIRLAGYDDTYFFMNEVLDQAKKPRLDMKKGRLAEALRRVSLLVSEGNIIVFTELARPFVSFINTFYNDHRYDIRKLKAFLERHFQPGSLALGGQDYLIEAFSAYYHARFENDPKSKAEYILQGNLLVGFHEQSRLQPQIEQALSVPLDVFRNHGHRGDASQEKRPSSNRLRHIVTRATTQMLMSITLPSRELRLNQDVIAPTGVESFPLDLFQIANPRCQALVSQFENRSNTLTGSAAEDWVSLQQRMKFVVNFFRSHQQYERLWEQPFSPSQVPIIEAGYLPGGPL